jgi:hypothetical protein
LAPWFAFAALPEKEFASAAGELIAGWKAAPPAFNASVLAAFATAEKPPGSLTAVAEVYNRVFAEADKAWQTAVEAAKKSGSSAPDALADAGQEAVRQVMVADNAPANLDFEAVSTLIRRQINDRTAALKRDVEALNWTEPGAPLRAMALVDKASPANSRVLLRGNPANRGPEVPRQFLEILAGEKRAPFTDGSGRLDLARAIADPANPLTARVFVNRVWGWYFSAGLVRTPSDFGVRTEAPVHRELLDWLAASFTAGGWSVKQLHRAIVLSNTYRQSGDERPEFAVADPDNQLLHRYNRRRLEFEALRDTLLTASDTIDLRAGGLSDDLTKQPFTTRRTVYGFIDRQNLPGMFRTFDYPNPDVSASQRLATTVPQQALFMLNSPFVQEQARRLARRPIIAAAESDEARIRALYRIIHQRAPEREEAEAARRFLQRPEEAAAMSGPETLSRVAEFAQVLLASNELAFVD